MMRPLHGDADIQHIDEGRWVYVDAARTTLTTPVFDPGRSLRLFDLQAQKLIQIVTAVRDSAATARARVLLANDATAAASSGVGGLLIGVPDLASRVPRSTRARPHFVKPPSC